MSADLATLDLAALTAEAERLGYVRDADGLAARWRAPWFVTAIVYTRGHFAPRWHDQTSLVFADEAAALRWLLDQPEARRLAAIVDAAEARGREQSPTLADVSATAVRERVYLTGLVEQRTAERDAAEARGREAERADVVAWLRDIADGTRARPDSRWDDVVDTLDALVDDVGRGCHRAGR